MLWLLSTKYCDSTVLLVNLWFAPLALRYHVSYVIILRSPMFPPTSNRCCFCRRLPLRDPRLQTHSLVNVGYMVVYVKWWCSLTLSRCQTAQWCLWPLSRCSAESPLKLWREAAHELWWARHEDPSPKRKCIIIISSNVVSPYDSLFLVWCVILPQFNHKLKV